MSKDLRAIGNALSQVALATYDFTPLAKGMDVTLDGLGFEPQQTTNADDSATTYTDQREAKKLQTVEHIVNTCNAFIKYIATSSVRKVATDGTVLSDTMITDVLLTEKAIVGAGKLAGQVGKNISLAGEGMYDLLPVELMDEVVAYSKTPAGDIVAISEQTGINLGRAAKIKAITDKVEFYEQAPDRTKTIINNTASLPGQSAEEAAAFNKSMELRMNHVKVVDPARLDGISDIEQINRYRAHTKNFHPDGLAKLNPDEVLHLNLCDWLEPKFRKINDPLKKSGGIKLRCMETGVEAVYEEYDLYHMVLGDIRPGSIRDHTKGSHILIPELQGKMFQVGEFKHLQNGYIDIQIRRGSNEILKTYFPRGTSVEKSVNIVEDAIKNAKEIVSIKGKESGSFRVTDQSENVFRIDIQNKKARPYPVNPDSI